MKLTIEQYNEEVKKILKSNLPVHETLIAFLDFAASVKIIKKKKKKKFPATTK